MKNNDVNKNILKAISIGLSATMSLMPTVTAYADDGGEGNIGRSDPVEDTATVSAPESDTNNESKEDVREAETTASTAETAAQTVAETPAAVPETVAAPAVEGTLLDTGAAEVIATDMGDVASVAAGLQTELTSLDQSNAKVLEENQYYEETAGVAEKAISDANDRTSEASGAIKAADEDIQKKASAAETTRDEVEDATEKIYDNKSAAEAAKSEATLKVEKAEKALEEAKGEAEAAQTKLDVAEKALEIADGKVEDARKAKKAADDAEKEAQDKLDKLIEENGLTVGEDGKVDTSSLKGDVKKAVNAAQDALDKASKMAEDAGTALTNAKTAADEAAGAVADAAKSRSEAAATKKTAADEKLATYDSDILESLIQGIKDQQAVVKGVTAGITDDLTANQNVYTEYEKENNLLAAKLAQYKLAQDPNIDPASVKIVYNDDGSVARNSNGNYVTISYKLKGSDETKLAYYGYRSYEGSGEESKKSEFLDPDHIVVFEKTAKDEAAASFAGKGDGVLTLLKADGITAPEDDASLGEVVDKINELKSKVKNGNWKDMRALAAYLAEYYLVTEKGLSLNGLSVPLGFGNNKSLVAGQSDTNYILIDYVDENDKIQHFYFDYSSNDEYKTSLTLLQKTVTRWNPSGMETSTDPAISESAFNAGGDSYQSAKTEVSDSEKEIEASAAAAAAAEDLAKRYEDTDLAKAALESANTELADFMANYKESERMDQLLELMKQQQSKIQKDLEKTTSNFYENSGELARYMAEYYLRMQEDVDPDTISVGEWHRKGENSKNKDHYFAVTYQVKGSDEVKTLYFDYLPVFANGETASASTLSAGTYGTLKDVDHIELVTKTPANEDATSFKNKGGVVLNEKTINNGEDDYQASKSEKIRLEKAVADADAVYSTAQTIKQLKADEATANDLKTKVDKAKKAVDEAVEALAKARRESALNADLIKTLEKELADAQTAYGQAVSDKAAADEKVETMKATVKEARDLLDREFRYRTPSADEDRSDDTSDDDTDTGSETVTPGGEIGGVTPDVTPTVPGGVPGGVTGGGAGVAAAGGAAGGAVDAGVLGDMGDELMGGEVLGERQAPVADAATYDMASELSKEAASMTENGVEKLSFWWMIIVAIFGQAGYKLYEKSKKKRVEATTSSDDNK